MFLILQAVTLNEVSLSQPIVARFDATGGTIGRADHNTMALPDPERHISRVQAEVFLAAQGGDDVFHIRNLGSANPIFVGSRSLGKGESAALLGSEPLRIGGYLLRVRPTHDSALEQTHPQPVQSPVAAAAPAAAHLPTAWDAPVAAPAERPPLPPPLPPPPPPPAPPLPPPAAASSPAPAPISADDPFADLFGGASARPARSDDPFADLLPQAPAGVMPGSAALPAPAAAPPAFARLPDDFDVFAPPTARPPDRAAASSDDPFADLQPRAPSSIDDAFGLEDGAGALDRFMADAGRPRGATRLSTDPLALFGADADAPHDSGSRSPAPHGLPQRDDLPGVQAAYRPPVVPVPPEPAPAASGAAFHAPDEHAPPQPSHVVPAHPLAQPEAPTPAPQHALRPATATATASGADQALWAALCEGAGVALPMPADAAERMRTIGRMLRAAIDGTIQLMAVRSNTRHELHAAVTVIQAQHNNPLKFSPDAQSGIEQLMQPAARGFLDGPVAMDDAMQDLIGHSIGTVAGMRSALAGMLDRFDPAALEARLVGKSRLENLLPMARRARLWDSYVEHHKGIREDAQDDFHTLFGKAFLSAYEEQVARLRRGRGQP